MERPLWLDNSTMTTDRYRKLIDDICRTTGLGDPSALYQMAHLRIDNVPFVLVHGGPSHDDEIFFFCDFGPPPQEQPLRARVLERLLEANVVLFGPGKPHFGLNFATGHVLLSGALPLAQLEAASLLELLRAYAAQARQWQAKHFLLDQERTVPAPSPHGSSAPTRYLN